MHSIRLVTILFALSLLAACGSPEEAALPEVANDDLVVTLLFTNDIESAYEPVPAFWIDGMERIGGIAQMATLIETIREREPNVFLFDAGDIFTGALSRLTDGQLMFEFMISMGYDAMAIGNHEFDYGESVLQWQMNRTPFPVLSANLFHKDTEILFAQPHAIIERDDVRIGVVGLLGQDAASTAIAREHIDELDVADLVPAAQRSIDEIGNEVDVVVVLTHMGHTAPMQTDAEIDPRLARDIDADLALAGALNGVDVLFGGHADAGTPEPVVQPDTGTLVMQTYGQATYLGYLQLVLDSDTKEIKSYDGKLIPVNADELAPHPVVAAKNRKYHAQYPEIFEVVGSSEARLNRRYFDESDLGNLIADVLVDATGADIALMHPGGIRKDIPAGDVAVVDILDTNPFVDPSVVIEISGEQLIAAMEQSFSHLRGLMQVSGLEVIYDTSKPVGSRLVSLTHNGDEVRPEDTFSAAMAGIIALGGDHYDMFVGSKRLQDLPPLGELMIAYFRKTGHVPVPASGRQQDLAVSP